MPKLIAGISRLIQTTVIEVSDEQWEQIQNKELDYSYSTGEGVYFMTPNGKEIEILAQNVELEYDEYGRDGLFDLDEGDYI